MIAKCAILLFISWPVLSFSEIVTVDLTVSDRISITKAELHYDTEIPAKAGVLILCPGMNGDGRALMSEQAWRNFAKNNGLGLASISFTSPVSMLYGYPARGYYYAEQGSGDALVCGLKQVYGTDSKVLMYGFSGGAQFASRFAQHYSSRMVAWAAYSASFWGDINEGSAGAAPGLIACGEFDSDRYGPSLTYFQRGRRVGARWTWISLRGTGHARHRGLERFVEGYFSAILSGARDPQWVDVETMQPTTENDRILNPYLSVWLPSMEMKNAWLKLHHP